jgi:deoxyribonuclease V
MDIKYVDAILFAYVDFNGSVLGHRKEVCRRALYDEARRGRQMRLHVKHKWNVSVAEARKIQEGLRTKWVGEDRLGEIRTVAGLDAAFVLTVSQAMKAMRSRWAMLRDANRAIAAVVVYKYPEMNELERAYAEVRLEFPYVPGFLSFREVPALLAALARLRRMPDLLFCDGQGYAHPRRMGLASHLGIVLDRPTIGCAKSILIGTHGLLGDEQGSLAALKDERETIGAALRTRAGVKPMYVSQGHRVTLKTALRLTLSVCDGRRIPRPTRDADHYVSEVKLRMSGQQVIRLATG